MATYLTSNTGSTKSTDRTAGGSKPDNTPATGTTTGGSGGSGVTQIVAGTNVTISPSGGTGVVTINAGSGLTSVGLAMPSEFTVSSSPLTANGTITVTKASEAQNSFYAGPASSGPGLPSFRAIAASDVPTLNQNTTGNAATVTGLSVASGKTLTANNTLTLSATDGSTLSIGGGGTLGSAAYTPTSQYVAASSGSAANLTLTGTLTADSSVGTSGYFLQTTGTGVKWAAASGTSGVSSITGNNGITPSTATSGAVTLGLAAITPASVNGITLSGSSTPSLSVTGTSSISGSSSGTNTGDQTNITGNAGTATKLATGRTIAITGDLAYTSPSFDGSANVTAGGTLASIVTAAGPIGSSTTTPVVTIDAKGRVTALSSATISGTLPSGATTSQSLLYGTSAAGWYTEHFDVKAFGATGNGSTDDHLAVNNAIAALNAAGGGVLYFPYGTYKMTAAITNITVPCRVIGDGINASTINQTSTSDALVISTSQQCIVQDITLQCTSSYNALTITAPSGSFNPRSIVNNVNVGGYPAIGFNFNEAFAIITNCTLTGAIGIQIQNLVNPDVSAGMITQCQFNTNGCLGVALYADGVH